MPLIKNPTVTPIKMWVPAFVSDARKAWHEKNKRPVIEVLCNGVRQAEYIMKWKVNDFLHFIQPLAGSTQQKGLRIYIAQFGSNADDLQAPKGLENQLTAVFSPATSAGPEDEYVDDKKYYIITELNQRIVLVQNNQTANQRVKRYNDDCRKKLSLIFGHQTGGKPSETRSVLHTHQQLAEVNDLIQAINNDNSLEPDVAFVWLRFTSYMEKEGPNKWTDENDEDEKEIALVASYQKRLTVEFDLADEDGNLINIEYDQQYKNGLNNGGLCPPNACCGSCLPEDDPECEC